MTLDRSDSLLVARQWERYDRSNDATGSAEAGNGRDSIGQGTRSGPSFGAGVDYRGVESGPPREVPPCRQDRWRQSVS